MLLVFAMWYAGIGFKAGAAYRMVSTGLYHRLPLLLWYLVSCSVTSTVLAILWRHRLAYFVVYSATTPLNLLAQGAALVSIFWALSVNYPNFRNAGAALLVIVSLFGVGAAFASAHLSGPAHPGTYAVAFADIVQLGRRYASVALGAALLATRIGLPKVPSIPIPIYARRAADIFIFDSLLGLVATWAVRTFSYGKPAISFAVPCICGFVLGACWLLAVRPTQERVVKLPSQEELDRNSRRWAMELHMIAVRLRDAGRTFDLDR